MKGCHVAAYNGAAKIERHGVVSWRHGVGACSFSLLASDEADNGRKLGISSISNQAAKENEYLAKGVPAGGEDRRAAVVKFLLT
jgi:hypothetical protein